MASFYRIAVRTCHNDIAASIGDEVMSRVEHAGFVMAHGELGCEAAGPADDRGFGMLGGCWGFVA